ncbi:hypothetical protein AN218_04510 [Streptomyces nanshensis]|uniref:Uncharacterized protein n=1 Tax=Streptomyces nanshensis TaxID=518642 RepID=A0A1E7LAK6_9ACTN|nr:hypothetical protein AN218_04510 [Streptomyces nanshensis]
MSVLTCAATGPGVQALQTLLHVALAEGLPLHHTVVAVTAPGPGRTPAPVRAALTMLDGRVAAAIEVPHEPHIRSHGLADPLPDRSGARTAARRLARAVLQAAHQAAGDPLPHPPVPAPTAAASPTSPTSSTIGAAR